MAEFPQPAPYPSSQRVVLVADIGGTKISLGYTEAAEETHHHSPELHMFPTDTIRDPAPVEAIAALLEGYTVERRLIPTAAVLGVPASLDRGLDKVLSSPNIPQLEGIFLARELGSRLGYPVYLERDIVLLLLGEYQAGAAQGAASVLGVFFGTGVGAAMLHEGRPYRGHSVGLELGHIPIRGEGRQCVCGNTDCLEAYACGHTLNRLAQQVGLPVAELFARQQKSPELKQALHEFVRDQAYAVATAINLFDPEVCLIGGGIPRMEGYPKEIFVGTVLEHLRRPYPRETVRLVWAKLGSEAVLHGARAVLVQRNSTLLAEVEPNHGSSAGD
ncbi:ROK family protein [Calidithermus timidus]|jgi:allose kinase|uniref:ROK family protein n=1 Tax=Calidithermus timidus TaxID=307124 RepID=UPI00036ADE26|nr:ROK family protein [Calidithermus timidus]